MTTTTKPCREYNGFLGSKAKEANRTIRKLFVTVTSEKRNLDEARAYFARIGAELTANFARLDSKLVPVGGMEKLRVLHGFFRPAEDFDPGAVSFDADVRDYIAPASFHFKRGHFRIGDGFGRALYLKDYPAYLAHTGGYETLYAHCSRIAVRPDEEVYKGQVIGFIGETGNVTGPHLHFVTYKGGVVSDPMGYYVPK